MIEVKVSEDLQARAVSVLGYKDVVNHIIKGLAEEMANNHLQVIRLWEEVRIEAEKQGIVATDDDNFNFNAITGKFTIVKK